MSPKFRFDRRAVLWGSAALGFPLLLGRCRLPEDASGLVADPDGLLDLPPGFSYQVLQRAGAPMDDGYRVPGSPDGMACFEGPAGSGTWILMRNHELGTNSGRGPYADGQSPPPESYERDEGSHGGVTRLVVDAATLSPVSSNLVLVGTTRNCAGGTSPWGWLTCEEDVGGAHGYVFLCDPFADRVRPPVRIPAWGKMNHEAAVVDPATGIAYLTEDRNDSCFYRFVPSAPTEAPGPAMQGSLQALRVTGESARDMNQDVQRGSTFSVDWVDLLEPGASDDSLRAQAKRAGAATFRRGEGIYFHAGAVFFCATSGGPEGGGQIWRYVPSSTGGGKLELVAQVEDRSVLDMPDNLCVAPWGDIVLAEDGADLRWPEQFLRVLTPDARVINLARNAGSGKEFAGVTFSPDGSVLFCNLQGDGLTVAITGPFRTLTGT